jgi:hypothetical protein
MVGSNRLSGGDPRVACGNGDPRGTPSYRDAGVAGEAGDSGQASAGAANDSSAPPLDPTVVSDFSSAYRFLFDGRCYSKMNAAPESATLLLAPL